jgi:arabinofuranosyltransferase
MAGARVSLPVPMDSRRIPPWAQRALVLGITWSIAAAGVLRAWSRRWSCDDAFISFRYADHLAHGQGLVWNVGERVEGFSNLLWTLLFVPAAAADLDLVVVSEVLGVLSLLGRRSPVAVDASG